MLKFLALIAVMFATANLNNVSDTCTLPAPSDNGSSHNGTSITVSWTAVTSAVDYRLIVTDLDNGDEIIYNDIVPGLSKTISGTNPNHDYRARVAAKCSGGEESNLIIIVDLNGA